MSMFSLFPDSLWRCAFDQCRCSHAGDTARNGRKRRPQTPPTHLIAHNRVPEGTKRSRSNVQHPRRGRRSRRTTETTPVPGARTARRLEPTRQLSISPTLRPSLTTLITTLPSLTPTCTTKTLGLSTPTLATRRCWTWPP